MPDYPPPDAPPNRPKLGLLEAGSVLYRVHSAKFAACGFNPSPAVSGAGGRFDTAEGTPAYLYAARSRRTAIAESLLRAVPFDARGVRAVPLAALRSRCLSELVATADITLVSLHGPGLARVGQDTWLVRSDSAEYPRTREWAAAIMRWAPSASGLEWRPRHDDDGLAVCLYEDRVLGGALEVVRTLMLEVGEGRAVVRSALREFGFASP